jgi:hypothetical protein
VIATMPRPRPPYLSREATCHKKPVWYVRRSGKRIRLKANFGTPEFNAENQAAIASTLVSTANVPRSRRDIGMACRALS